MGRAVRPLSLSLLGLSVLGLGSVQAAVAPVLSLEQQARRADLIVRGSLGTPQTVTEGAVTWRVYPLTLSETVVGDTGRLPRQAGEPALYVWSEAGDLPQWRTGQDAFFLLYAARLDSPLVGYNQGYYPVVDGAVTLPEGGRPAAEAQQAAGVPTPAAPAAPAQPAPPQPVQPGAGLTELAPPPAGEAPDAPVSPGRPAESLPGLPSASVPTASLPSAGAPVPPATPAQAAQAAQAAPSSPASQGSAQVSADEFRALLLRARGASGGAGQ